MLLQCINTYLEVLVAVALKEVGSRRSCRVLLLPASLPCAPAPVAAAAALSTSHTTDRKVLDDQEQTGLPGVL